MFSSGQTRGSLGREPGRRWQVAPASRIRPSSLRIPARSRAILRTLGQGTSRPGAHGGSRPRLIPLCGLGSRLGHQTSGLRVIWGRRKEEKKFGSLGCCEGAGLHMVTVGDSARGLAPGRRTGTETDPWRLGLQAWDIRGDGVLAVCACWHEKAVCNCREDGCKGERKGRGAREICNSSTRCALPTPPDILEKLCRRCLLVSELRRWGWTWGWNKFYPARAGFGSEQVTEDFLVCVCVCVRVCVRAPAPARARSGEGCWTACPASLHPPPFQLATAV